MFNNYHQDLLKTKDTMNSLGNRYIKSNTKIFICKHFSKRRNAIGKENERADNAMPAEALRWRDS